MRDASAPSSRAVSYFQEIRCFPMLKAEEEYILAVRWRGRGDRNGLMQAIKRSADCRRDDGAVEWQDRLVMVPTRNRAEIQEHETRRTALGLALTVLDDRDRHIFEARRLVDSPIMLEQLAMAFLISREPCAGS